MKPYVWGALFFVVALIVLGAVFAHMPTGPSLRPKPPVISNAGTGGMKPGAGGNGVPPDLVQIPKLATPPPGLRGRGAVLLTAARVEHQSWPEARNARAGGVANARIDNPI